MFESKMPPEIIVEPNRMANPTSNNQLDKLGII